MSAISLYGNGKTTFCFLLQHLSQACIMLHVMCTSQCHGLEYVISVGIYTKDALHLNVKIGSQGRSSPQLGLVESFKYIYQSNDRTPMGYSIRSDCGQWFRA